MKQYDYPIKMFNGSALDIFPRQLLDQGLKFFDEKIAFEHKIAGETGIDGVLIDFNNGLRLQIPEGNWHVRISDYQSDLVFIDDDLSAVTLISREKFFVHWEIALWLDGEPTFYHQFDPRGARVHFLFARPIGDNIALLPYVEEFRQKFDCQVSCTIPSYFREIVKNYYPNVELTNDLPDDSYACFYMAAWSNMPFAAAQDFRTVPLEFTGKTILCSPLIAQPSKVICRPTKPRTIEGKYVCIGVQASGTNKCWLAPDGWRTVVDHLKSLGYRVLCIDRDQKCTNYGMTVNDFSRVGKCVSYKDAARKYECSKKISARQVIDAIDRLVGSLK